jgi:ABC-type nitrate/sulfonate/bicarbonate transport system permease component
MLDVLYTSTETVVGLALAIAVGTTLFVFCVRFPAVNSVMLPSIRAMQVIPFVVFAPLVSLFIGVGLSANTLLAATVGVFPYLSVLLDSNRRIPLVFTELIEAYEIRSDIAFKRLLFPYLLPSAFAAARVSAALCLVGAVVAEFLGARYGLGRNIFEASVRINPELMISSALTVVVLGWGLNALSRRLERRVVRWSS